MREFYRYVKQQLQLPCSVEDYLLVMDIAHGGHPKSPEAVALYQRCIPYYTISRCPYCDQHYQAQFDIYSLGASADPAQYHRSIASETVLGESELCRHFLACDTYNYLHELPHVIENGWKYKSRIPRIQTHLLPDDLECCVVMHALPMCQIENNLFVPRFTKFFMTYFDGSGEDILFERNRARIGKILERDPEYYENLLNTMSSNPLEYDLISFVKRKRLRWLDIYNPNLPLRDEPVELFPYGDLHNHTAC